MNYGIDDLEMFKQIVKLIEDPDIIAYLNKIIENWDSYLSIINMIDNRINKIESYRSKDAEHYTKIEMQNDRLRLINKELVNLIGNLGVI